MTGKNILFLCVIIGLLTVISHGATALSPGFACGASIANVVAKDQDGNDYFFEQQMFLEDRFGINAHLFLEMELLNWLLIAPGIGYVNRGYAPGRNYYSSTGPSENWKITVKSDYITVPVLFKARVPNWRFRPFGLLGVEAGFLTKSEAEWPDTTYDVTKTMNDFDFGWNFGFGLDAVFGNLTPFIQLSMYRGLANSAKSYITVRNVSFAAQAGMKFRL
jgi:hypothetical protein